MDFIKAFSNQVSDQLLVTKQNKENEPRPRGMAMDASERSAGPVQRVETFVQFNTIPKIIELEDYADAHSSSNPGGGYQAAYKLFELSDPIPQLKPTFTDSNGSLMSQWDLLVNSAWSENEFTTRMISNAQNKFGVAKLQGMGGVPQDWYLINAVPQSWTDLIQDSSNLTEITLEKDEESENAFLTMEGGGLNWVTLDDRGRPILASNSSEENNLQKVTMHLFKLDLERPWLDFDLLKRKDWKINGVGRTYFSNGKLKNNRGVLPLIITSLLITAKTKVIGAFEKEKIEQLKKDEYQSVNLGPIALRHGENRPEIEQEDKHGKTAITSSVIQLVGYISHLTPLSPSLPKKNRRDQEV
ncbi:MAG: hypothetical protein ACRBG0_02550 [Lewinella sp.]|jgi:hypothetical protein|uniref:hypothetical protein n=1 Tax=Lewinella sp. TaxID=2004506 RepID=UPI003D6C4751